MASASRVHGAVLLLTFVCVGWVGAIRTSVMLPLMAVDPNTGQVQDIRWQLSQLRNAGVAAVMTDVWWGIVEQAGPRQYNWTAYLALADMVQAAGLNLQCVMSFHKCGGNAGDDCNIPLPQWVRAIGQSNPDIFYRDQYGNWDDEYLTLGVDEQPLFQGRTALELYTDFMQSFVDNFRKFMPWVINQVQVGLGPSGELRYPAYQNPRGWNYCGSGAFQCYDRYMLQSLQAAAVNASHPEWGKGGPNNAGGYMADPRYTGFYQDFQQDNYASPYGKFFLSWYAGQLLQHAERLLEVSNRTFQPLGVSVAGKIAGIHWWYHSPSHAAEITAGYYNTNYQDAYYNIAQTFARHNVDFDFTCLELFDDNNCASGPQELVQQTRAAAKQAGISYEGENALDMCNPSCDANKFKQVFYQATQPFPMKRFTFLRLDNNLMQQNNLQTFASFVSQMSNAN